MNPKDSNSAHVLVVDDHPNTASMLARALGRSEKNLEVSVAHSGEEAFTIMEDSIVDVLITDFLLPGISGLELIRKIRRDLSTGPEYIILITAYGSMKLTEAVRFLKINEYLLKPVTPDTIVNIIGNVIEGLQATVPVFSEGTSSRQFNILVADDNDDNLRLVTKNLGQDGYQFITASDGESVLTKLRTEAVDLLLLDINMPKKDGFEVLAEMRADPQLQYIPVIVLSAARIDSSDIRTGLSLGADDYITKPLDWRELIARVRTKLRVKQFEDSLRRRNHQLSLLPEIGQDLSARTDLNEIAELLLDRTSMALDAAAAHLALIIDGEFEHRLYSNRDFTSENWDEIQKQFCQSKIFTHVFDRRVGTVVEDAHSDILWKSDINPYIKSILCLPLLGQRDVIGVLTLAHEQGDHFNEETLTFLRAIASQAAIAIEDAQLYTMERKRANELAALNQLTQKLSSVTRSDELFDNFSQAIHDELHYPLVTLWDINNNQPNLIIEVGSSAEINFEQLAECPTQVLKKKGAVLHSRNGRRPSTDTDHQDELENAETARKSTSSIAVPIYADEAISHILAVYGLQQVCLGESDFVVLEMLASQISAALERIRLFESVEQEQHRISAVLQAAADAILVFDRDGLLQLMNPAAHKLFTDVETQIGRGLPDNRGYDDLIEMLSKARLSGIAEKSKILWPDQRTFAVLITPIEEGGQVVVLHDVSHYVDLERVKNEFIATVSHDLKSPIGAVLGFSDLMEKAGPLNDKQKDFVGRIRDASARMHELVINMLDLIRIDLGVELTLVPFDLHNILSSVTHDLRAQARAKDQEIQLDLPEGRPQVLGSVSRLRQVLYNLIGNAIKYTPNGGQISLHVDQEESKVWVCITDTGYGIPPEDIPFIFDKFYRVDLDNTKDIDGNGLGLAIVKAIVEQHHGEVAVESTLGEGSIFRFSLSLVKDIEMPAPLGGSDSGYPDLKLINSQVCLRDGVYSV